MRALVMDASRASRRLIGRTVAELGFVCIEVGTGREALDRLVEAGKVDLLLVDWHMGEMRGPDLLAAVRANPVWRNTVILVVMAEAEAGEIQRALAAGASDCVMQPFTCDVLREKLQLVGLAPE